MANSEAVVRRCSIKKAFLTLLEKSLWHRCFPVNFAKFLRTPFLQNSSGGCFCKLQVNEKISFTHTPPCILPSFSQNTSFSENIRIYYDYFFQRGFESVPAQFLSGNIDGKQCYLRSSRTGVLYKKVFVGTVALFSKKTSGSCFCSCSITMYPIHSSC